MPGRRELAEIDWEAVDDLSAGQPAPIKAVTTYTMQEAASALGTTRNGLRTLIRRGKLAVVGKDEHDWNLLDKADVDGFAADRAAKRFEREAVGVDKEERELERAQGISSDPRSWERDARGRAAASRSERMHAEQLAATRALQSEIEFGFQRLLTELRSQTQHLATLQESLSSLNTGALIAAGAVAAVAVTPADVKADVLEKIQAPFRKKSPETAPAVGKVRTVTGELVERRPLEEPDLRELSEGLDQIFDRVRVATATDGKE